MSLQYLLSWLAGTGLACYGIREVKNFFREYPRVKHAVAQGDREARVRLYWKILRFEWTPRCSHSLRLDWIRENLWPLGCRWTTPDSGTILGGLIIMTVARLRGRLRAPVVDAAARPWWRRIVPDITTLIPTTGRERLLFAAAAISAGIGEEIVFPGMAALRSARRLRVDRNAAGGARGGALRIVSRLPGSGVLGTTAAGLLLTAL
jgi:hypothetical protein